MIYIDIYICIKAIEREKKRIVPWEKHHWAHPLFVGANVKKRPSGFVHGENWAATSSHQQRPASPHVQNPKCPKAVVGCVLVHLELGAGQPHVQPCFSGVESAGKPHAVKRISVPRFGLRETNRETHPSLVGRGDSIGITEHGTEKPMFHIWRSTNQPLTSGGVGGVLLERTPVVPKLWEPPSRLWRPKGPTPPHPNTPCGQDCLKRSSEKSISEARAELDLIQLGS